MTHEEILDVLAARERAFRHSDPGGMTSVYTEDAVLVSPMFGTLHGRQAIEAAHRKLFAVFHDMTIATDPAIIEGDRAAQTFCGHATHTTELFGVPPSHRFFEVKGVFVFEFAHGKIAHERRLYDFSGLLLQLGVLKAK